MGRRRVEPGPGQESVWDYPRPPRLESTDRRVKVVFGGVTVAYTTRALRKGRASYYDVVTDERTEERAAWYYPEPVPAYAEIRDHIAFYPSRMDACWVGGRKVRAQEGDFYGGWITPDVIGPFKGAPGTWGW